MPPFYVLSAPSAAQAPTFRGLLRAVWQAPGFVLSALLLSLAVLL